MKLIAGLGNPGKKYAAHRHNIGFLVMDAISDRCEVNIGKRFMKAFVGKGSCRGIDVLLVKPQTFMNLSGDSVIPIMGFYKVKPSDLIVIHDDIDIDFGKIKISYSQGHAGHNGVRSIVDSLGSNEFYRVRLGVGRPPEYMDSADYVLKNFDEDEKNEVGSLVNTAADAVEVLVLKGLKEAQQIYH